MIKVKGKEKEYQVEITESGILLDNDAFNLDLIENKNGSFHSIHNSNSFNIEIVKANYTTKEFQIKINDNLYSLNAKDKYDVLLEKLGMDSVNEDVAEDLKAPMPGLVIDIKVEAGQEVEKGDLLLVLEAMKMENNIKSQNTGVVKSIEIEKGQAVEKNQVLITFEK